MAGSSKWTILDKECPEEKRKARLLLGWTSEEGEYLLTSIHCDHPRLKETDNWDCDWACVEEISSKETDV